VAAPVPRSRRAALLAGAAVVCAACAPGPETPRTTAAPPRPAACRQVSPGTPLAAAIEATPAGGALCLAPGVYAGPVTIDRGVTVWGPRDAVIRSGGGGTTVRLRGAGPRLQGVTVDGSGGRFDLLDAAVAVRGDDAVVEGVRVIRAVFGLLVERSRRATVRGNHVIGPGGRALGLRGDGIRLWETDDSTIEGNLVEDARDLVVWYSRRNRIADNQVRGGRYGTHFMYSHGNTVVGNRYIGNVVGVFVMYSRGIELRANLLAGSGGAAGVGLGLKEAGELRVRDNVLIGNAVGIYADTSPLSIDDTNRFEGNTVRLCGTAVVFHGGAERNEFRGNTFRDNLALVEVEGGGDALAAVWDGNDWDDYAGYDLDGDGTGDVPFEHRSVPSALVARRPELAFFRGTPALALASWAGEAFPLLAPRPILRDERPRFSAAGASR
jgi:nitrous oxidase accessory protein